MQPTVISQVVVFGDGKKFLTALVDINEQHARSRMAELGEPETPAIRKHPLLSHWVGEKIEAVNRDLASFETIKAFVIAEATLTPESGLLTPSLKVRRNKVYEKYRDELDALYIV